jgi:hypothetical protein
MEETIQKGKWHEAVQLLSQVYSLKIPLTRQTFNTFLTNFVRYCPDHPRRIEALHLAKKIFRGVSYPELATFIQCLLMDAKKDDVKKTSHKPSRAKQENFDWSALKMDAKQEANSIDHQVNAVK